MEQGVVSNDQREISNIESQTTSQPFNVIVLVRSLLFRPISQLLTASLPHTLDLRSWSCSCPSSRRGNKSWHWTWTGHSMLAHTRHWTPSCTFSSALLAIPKLNIFKSVYLLNVIENVNAETKMTASMSNLVQKKKTD